MGFSDCLCLLLNRLFEWCEVWVGFEDAGRDRISDEVVGSNPQFEYELW